MQFGRTIRSRKAAVATLVLAGLILGGCQSGSPKHPTAERIKSDPKERFTESDYGVKASPRVTDLRNVRKGGGREQLGRPYKVRGKWYYPKEQPGYAKVGNASWYGSSFHGRLTANGEVYDMFGLSAAHPTFPLPSYARVTNVATGANVVVRVNDRGPYVADRMMDLSSTAAEMLGYKSDGVGRIKVEYVGKAPLDGDDTPMLMASYHPGNAAPSIDDGLASGVMLAMNETPARTYASPTLVPQAQGLPGVRTGTEATSIDAIINGAMPVAAGTVPLPRSRHDASNLIVSSYAPGELQMRSGAADAVSALARPSAVAGQRIDLGMIDDAKVLNVVRRIAESHGRLITDAGGGTATYAVDVAPGEDADILLRALWQAGASDAFVLRD